MDINRVDTVGRVEPNTRKRHDGYDVAVGAGVRSSTVPMSIRRTTLFLYQDVPMVTRQWSSCVVS